LLTKVDEKKINEKLDYLNYSKKKKKENEK